MIAFRLGEQDKTFPPGQSNSPITLGPLAVQLARLGERIGPSIDFGRAPLDKRCKTFSILTGARPKSRVPTIPALAAGGLCLLLYMNPAGCESGVRARLPVAELALLDARRPGPFPPWRASDQPGRQGEVSQLTLTFAFTNVRCC